MIERLYEWNPWWKGKNYSLPSFQRAAFGVLKKGVASGKIQIIAGPRQTGKTTLLRQLIADLHASGTDPKKTLYLPLDAFESELGPGDIRLQDLIQLFSEEISGTPLDNGEKYVFLDEVHVCPGWNKEVKLLHDQGLPLHIVVSGSASAIVLKEAALALAGRTVENILLPLSFLESVSLNATPDATAEWRETSTRLGQKLLKAFDEVGFQDLVQFQYPLQTKMAGQGPLLRAALTRYLRRGGFPEQVFKHLPDEEADVKLQAILDQMVRRDFVEFFHVRDTKTLERTIRIVAQNTGRILSERKMSSDLGVAVNTVRNHLGFLEKAYVIFCAKALTGSASSQSRMSEKYFFLDNGLRNALVGFQEDDRGRLLESAVFVHLWAFVKKNRPSIELLHFRDRNKEVDIVLRQGRALLGIEVHTQDSDVKGLRAFLSAHPTAFGLLVSDTIPEKREERIAVVPPHLFLLLE